VSLFGGYGKKLYLVPNMRGKIGGITVVPTFVGREVPTVKGLV